MKKRISTADTSEFSMNSSLRWAAPSVEERPGDAAPPPAPPVPAPPKPPGASACERTRQAKSAGGLRSETGSGEARVVGTTTDGSTHQGGASQLGSRRVRLASRRERLHGCRRVTGPHGRRNIAPSDWLHATHQQGRELFRGTAMSVCRHSFTPPQPLAPQLCPERRIDGQRRAKGVALRPGTTSRMAQEGAFRIPATLARTAEELGPPVSKACPGDTHAPDLPTPCPHLCSRMNLLSLSIHPPTHPSVCIPLFHLTHEMTDPSTSCGG